MQMDEQNRREFPRVAYPCLVKFFSEKEGQEVYLTHTENISRGGCYLIVPRGVKKGDYLLLEVDLLDHQEHLNIQGKVMWSEKRSMLKHRKTFYYDVGIAFVGLSEANQSRLEETIHHLIKKGYQPLRPVH